LKGLTSLHLHCTATPRTADMIYLSAFILRNIYPHWSPEQLSATEQASCVEPTHEVSTPTSLHDDGISSSPHAAYLSAAQSIDNTQIHYRELLDLSTVKKHCRPCCDVVLVKRIKPSRKSAASMRCAV